MVEGAFQVLRVPGSLGQESEAEELDPLKTDPPSRAGCN